MLRSIPSAAITRRATRTRKVTTLPWSLPPGPRPSTTSTARWRRRPPSFAASPGSQSSIIAAERIVATGLAIPFPAMSGAVPLGLDQNNAHVQPGGVYHYHGMPEGLLAAAGATDTNRKMVLVGWAGDGYPVYARYCYSSANDATSPYGPRAPSRRKLATRQ